MSKGWRRLRQGKRRRRNPAVSVQRPGGYSFTWYRKGANYSFEKLGITRQTNGHLHLNEDKDGKMVIPESQPIDNEHVIKSGASVLLSEREPEPIMTLKKQVYWSELILKHGTDYKAMEKDVKLNSALYSETKCKKMCELYMKQMEAPILPSAKVGAKKTTK